MRKYLSNHGDIIIYICDCLDEVSIIIFEEYYTNFVELSYCYRHTTPESDDLDSYLFWILLLMLPVAKVTRVKS